LKLGGKEAPPTLKVIENEKENEDGLRDHLDAVILQGARRMLAAALEAEVQEYVDRYQHHRDEKGHRQVVRNGKAKARTVTTGAGQLEVEAPRVNDKRVVDGERQKCETREQRCWFHKLGNVTDKLPKRLQAKGKRLLHEVVYAATRDDAEEAIEKFTAEFSPKHQRAVDCLTKDREKLLTFFDFPAEHWKHLRTTNVIESSFATVRLRRRVTKCQGSGELIALSSAGLIPPFELGDRDEPGLVRTAPRLGA